MGEDSIWIAECKAGLAPEMTSQNIPTRGEAITTLGYQLKQCLEEKMRVLIGFDFGFGYPKGFAEHLTGTPNWTAVWDWIANAVVDHDDNTSNRFDVANKLNEKLGTPQFWGKPYQHADRYPALPAKKPPSPPLAEQRIVECYVKSAKSVFQMAYNGAVGSQTILGIARLMKLREILAGRDVRVWPFETSFTDNMLAGPGVVIAEIYPTLFLKEQPADAIKDQAQVEAVVRGLSTADAQEQLTELLQPPPGLSAAESAIMIAEEGSILGAGRL